MSLLDWMPKENKPCFFGTDLSEDYRKGWDEGRESFKGWYRKLSLWDRIKILFRGELL